MPQRLYTGMLWRILIVAALAFTNADLARAELQTYTISAWPQSISELPCSAFRKNDDGSWTLVARVKTPRVTMLNYTFKSTNESKLVAAKCEQTSPDKQAVAPHSDSHMPGDLSPICRCW
jgi:hypothetical protein